ncbi:MAG: protein kinase domain-containing protein [Microcoleaceae cyanobacterium]
MSYCLNPQCRHPENPEATFNCKSCGLSLSVKGQYRAIQLLGGGGMGRTFLAIAQNQDKTACVLKQFSPQIQTKASLKKATELFAQEAIRLQELGSHDQIPALINFCEQDGFWYLVQQFVDGKNLLQELEIEGVFNEAKITQLLKDLLPVLEFIHQHQVIHRDLKPENIIRRKADEKLVLVDFGIAKYNEDIFHPKTGTLIGTIGYAPLEQIRGGKAYPASDLYSLGMTCVHLLTQVPPAELFDALSGELTWRSHLDSDHQIISHQLGKILDKLLQDAVKKRYQSATEVLHDLQQLSCQPTCSSKFEGIVSLDIIASVGLEASENKPYSDHLPDYQLLGRSLREAPSLLALPEIPDSQVAISCLSQSQRLTSSQIALTESPVTCNLANTFEGHTAAIETIAIGPNSYLLASGSTDQSIRLWNLKTGQLLHQFLRHQSSVKSISIHPQGWRLISGSLDRTILAWNLNARKMTDQFFSHSGSPYSHRCGEVYAVAYSPDGKLVVSGGADHLIKVWNQRNGELLYHLNEHSDIVLCITFADPKVSVNCLQADLDSSPCTSLFASGGADGLIKLWRFGCFKSLQTLRGHTDSICSLAFSPNQRILVSGSCDRTIKLWNFQTGELLKILTGHTEPIRSVAISPNGTLLASGSSDGTIKLWNLDLEKGLGVLLTTLSGCHPVQFTSDNQALVSGDLNHKILVWKLQQFSDQ